MNAIHRILHQSVGGPFYRQHAGAFLFLFFILFGIQPSVADAFRTHYAIMVGILQSPNFYFVALACWMAYTLRCVLFFHDCLRKESFDLLFYLNAVNPRQRYVLLFQLACELLAPVIVYGILIIFVAIKNAWHLQGILIAVSLFVLAQACTFTFYHFLHRAKGLQELKSARFALLWPSSLTSFLVRFVFRKQFPTLLLLKLFSFGILYFFARTEASVFETRMLWLLYLTSLTGHSLIVYKNFHFVETELGFYRNMPVRKSKFILSLLLLYTILLIPEMWALRAVYFVQENGLDYLAMILTGPSFLLLLHGLLYTEDMSMDEYLKLLFGVWVVFVFFSLSRNHWILVAIALTFGAVILSISYDKYEKNAAVAGLE